MFRCDVFTHILDASDGFSRCFTMQSCMHPHILAKLPKMITKTAPIAEIFSIILSIKGFMVIITFTSESELERRAKILAN